MSQLEIENIDRSVNRLAAATERIAGVIERIDADNQAVDKLNAVTRIYDHWYNSREEGHMRPPEVVLDEIGEVLYRTAT